MRAIGETGGEAFYRGEIAQTLAAFNRQYGGSMTEQDLAAYQPQWVTPICKNYRGYTLHEIPPNGQGIAALIALGILDKFDVGSLPVDGVDSQHLQIEAMKLAFADVYKFVAEPTSMQVTAEQCWMTPIGLAREADQHEQAQDFGAGNPVKAARFT